MIFNLRVLILIMCASVSTALPTVQAKECVIFLHGLARTAGSMKAIANAFEKQGFTAINVSYPSRQHSIETLAPLAIEQGLAECPAESVVHFVTHSLGGILVRYYLQHNEVANLGRVVMLAPPNQGSAVVDTYLNVPGFVKINGPAVKQLGTDDNSVPLQLDRVDFELGVIAGTKSINPILSLSLENPDDGKVSMEKSKVEGMTDFVAVPHSHPYIMKSAAVIEHTLSFINTGRFMVDK